MTFISGDRLWKVQMQSSHWNVVVARPVLQANMFLIKPKNTQERWCASVDTKSLELSSVTQRILCSDFCPNLDRSHWREDVLIKKVTYGYSIAGSALLSDHQKANGFVSHTEKAAKERQVPLLCAWGTCDWRASHVLELCEVQLCRFLICMGGGI